MNQACIVNGVFMVSLSGTSLTFMWVSHCVLWPISWERVTFAMLVAVKLHTVHLCMQSFLSDVLPKCLDFLIFVCFSKKQCTSCACVCSFFLPFCFDCHIIFYSIVVVNTIVTFKVFPKCSDFLIFICFFQSIHKLCQGYLLVYAFVCVCVCVYVYVCVLLWLSNVHFNYLFFIALFLLFKHSGIGTVPECGDYWYWHCVRMWWLLKTVSQCGDYW